jgi:hypothetical protein
LAPGAADATREGSAAAHALAVAKFLLQPLSDPDRARCEARGGEVGGLWFGAIWCNAPPPSGSPWSLDVPFVTDGGFVFLMIHPRALDPGATERDLIGPDPPWPPEPKLLFGE